MNYTILKPLLDKKYLHYFNFSNKIEDENILKNFLNKMIEVSEIFAEDSNYSFKPIEILIDIKNRFCLDDIYSVSNQEIESLNMLETFALLWYYSCRNMMIYNKSIYYKMAQNGTIGKLLNQLNILLK